MLSTSTTSVPPAGAWLDASVTYEGVVTVQGSSRFGRNTGRSCLSFTTDQAGNESTYVAPSGAIVQPRRWRQGTGDGAFTAGAAGR